MRKSRICFLILMDLLSNGDPLSKLKRDYEPIPLKKKGNIEYETGWHISDLEKNGHKVLQVAQNRYPESVIIYRVLYGDGFDDSDITLRVKVITKNGVLIPDSNVFLIVHSEKKHMEIADIRIEGSRVNRGYGSIVMDVIIKLVEELGIKYITGWISNVDWDHIERSEHFYTNFGFECHLDHENKHGIITWLNESLGATQEELNDLIKKDIGS